MSDCQHACAGVECEHCDILDRLERCGAMRRVLRSSSESLVALYEADKLLLAAVDKERSLALAAIERVRAVCATIESHRHRTGSDRRAVLQQGERLAVSAILDALKA